MEPSFNRSLSYFWSILLDQQLSNDEVGIAMKKQEWYEGNTLKKETFMIS